MTLDWLALSFFIICWVSYSAYSNHQSEKRACFMNVARRLKQLWMLNAIKRHGIERQIDSNISTALAQNSRFFASTTVLIIAGSLAAFPTLDSIYKLMSSIKFSFIADQDWFYTRVLLIVIIFIYAFFKFTWAIIQINQASTAIGAISLNSSDQDKEKLIKDSLNLAELFFLAVLSFNAGIRAYYFAIAALAWFYHPIAFMAMSLLIVLVLYRRDFHSNTLQAMLRCLDLNQ